MSLNNIKICNSGSLESVTKSIYTGNSHKDIQLKCKLEGYTIYLIWEKEDDVRISHVTVCKDIGLDSPIVLAVYSNQSPFSDEVWLKSDAYNTLMDILV